jgi:thiamine-monophosphate kinase
MRAGAEFDAIRAMIERWGAVADGIGDDAALLEVPRGDMLAVSVDACIEGRHFREGWIPPRDIGYRAVAGALSDLAAMAAVPRGVLLSIVLPDRWAEHLLMIAQGAGEAVAAAGAHVVGGNMARGEQLGITTTVLGSVFGALRRDGARAGDRVYVTGRLGACGAAVDALLAGGPVSPDHLARFAHPTPRLAEARWLAARGATAATDISDGLLADIQNIEAASRVSVMLDPAMVPVWEGVPRERALTSGEEYELLVTASELDAAEFEARFAISLTEIGVVESAAPAGRGLHQRPGFDHFSM